MVLVICVSCSVVVTSHLLAAKLATSLYIDEAPGGSVSSQSSTFVVMRQSVLCMPHACTGVCGGVQVTIGTTFEEFFALFVGFGAGLDWAVPSGIMVKVGATLVSMGVLSGWMG